MGCTDRLACCEQIRAGCASQALACFLLIASSSAQPESDYRAVAIQCSDRVVELIEALIRRSRVVLFLADETRTRFFLYDRPSDSYLSTDLETLLSTAAAPSHGFRLFHRFCRTSSSSMGLPQPPVVPLVDGYTLHMGPIEAARGA